VDKAYYAQNAGAIGVILYLAPGSSSLPTFVENVDGFYGPAVGISNANGAALKNYVDAYPLGTTQVTIDPAGAVRAPDAAANLLASYSSLGPSLGAFPTCSGCAPLAIKPDLVATGGGDANLYPDPADQYLYGFPGMYLAAESYDPLGEIYSVTRYAAADGTSFAAPLTAGAAALVKQAHPGYTAAQIKSALVNWSNAGAVTASDCDLSAPTPCTTYGPLDTRWTGAGLLDAAAAAKATIVASPPTISFGAIMAGTSLPAAQTVTVANLGSSAVTLAVAVLPQTSGATITADKTSLSLGAAGGGSASATFHVSVTGPAPAAGAYSGQINLTAAGVAMHIPYLFLVGNNTVTTAGARTLPGRHPCNWWMPTACRCPAPRLRFRWPTTPSLWGAPLAMASPRARRRVPPSRSSALRTITAWPMSTSTWYPPTACHLPPARWTCTPTPAMRSRATCLSPSISSPRSAPAGW
jgi:hypothetical protein